MPAAREIVSFPSSIGWRRLSSIVPNSGSSSRNSTPLCASDTSPGLGFGPPPASPTRLIVWCGALNGLLKNLFSENCVSPAAEYMPRISRNSSRVGRGIIDGMRFAIMLFPEPGGPTISRLCPPATATSTALRTWCCPFTSAKSGIPSDCWGRLNGDSDAFSGSSSTLPRRKSTSSRRSRGA